MSRGEEFRDRLMPHVKKRIIDECKAQYGNKLIRITCGITGSGAEPNFQVETRDGKTFAHSGKTFETAHGTKYDATNVVEIWPLTEGGVAQR